MIFDTHAHYDDEAFQEDRKELLSGLFGQGVGNVVNAGAAARELPRILRLTEQYDFLYGAAGLHPCETYCSGDNVGQPIMHFTGLEGERFSEIWMPESLLLESQLQETIAEVVKKQSSKAWKPSPPESEYQQQEIDSERRYFAEGTDRISGMAASHHSVIAAISKILGQYHEEERITRDWVAADREMQLLQAMTDIPKIVAVGEIGLDYHYEDTQKEVQKEWFAAQIALAREKHLPIIVHSRDAAADTLDMILAEGAEHVGGIIHCFSYSREMAAQYVDLGFMIGIGGVVTYKNAKKVKEVVDYLPMDHLVLETDCPYLAPAPFRGKRNDSSMIHYVAQAIAEIKGLSKEEVIAVTEQNARRVFQLG